MIKILKPIGCCYGVKYSMNKVIKAHTDFPKTQIWLLHPLVHNPATNQEIAEKTGAKVYDPDLPPTTYRDALMVFPAHGSTSRDRLLTKYLNATPLDCTCPVLLNAKNMMKRDLKAGYFVFFVGKEGHPETLSVLDSDERIKLIKASEASSFDFTPYLAKTKIAIYPQSTLGQDTFQAVLTRAQAVFKTEIKAGQICHECLSRWQALDGLGLGLDFSFVVVGDPSSSNAVEFKDLIVKKYPKASVVLALDEKGLEAEISQISFRGDVFLVSATSASDQDVQKIYKKLKSAEKIYKLKHPFLGR